MQSIEIFIDEKDRRVMKKSVLATIMAGTMVLGMTACGTKPTETTAEPTTTTTAQETTAETTTEETTEETTAASEYPVLSLSGGGRDLITDVKVTNITYRVVNVDDYYDASTAESLKSLGITETPVYEAKADQDIVITFNCNEGLVIGSLDDTQSLKVKDGCTLTREGNAYTLNIPAKTFSAGDTCFIILQTEDYATNETGDLISGKVITTNFGII